MTAETGVSPGRLVDRDASLSAQQMIEHLVPSRQFADASLENYRPDAGYPSQGAAVAAIREFVVGAKAGRGLRRKTPAAKPGIYLDGGFGVGKTHLLAAAWHRTGGRKYFGTFIEYTALVGALGYATTVELLSGASLIAIDEFELDDPGDTRLMARLLNELTATGSRIAATSNTPPNALGEGRFAAQDFMREIDSLAGKFEVLRIDGLDYRHRDARARARVSEDVTGELLGIRGQTTMDDFDAVLGHLAAVHPSRYVRLVEGLSAIGLTAVHPFGHQVDALRFVAFVDRLYDAQVRVVAAGTPLDAVFPEEMLQGGYRKKYLRAISRLIALTTGSE